MIQWDELLVLPAKERKRDLDAAVRAHLEQRNYAKRPLHTVELAFELWPYQICKREFRLLCQHLVRMAPHFGEVLVRKGMPQRNGRRPWLWYGQGYSAADKLAELNSVRPMR